MKSVLFASFALAIAAAAAVAPSPVTAQDTSLNPSFGTHNLRAGFPNDPYRVVVRAGGRLSASRVGSGCDGSIAQRPDVRLNYRAGTYPLTIYVRSSHDTTLIVNTPDGRWHCDDDSGGDLDPKLRFGRPQSGQYDIWIGRYAGGSGAPARLYFTENE